MCSLRHWRLGRAEECGEARRWYRKAAEQGHGDAQSSLGAMFLEGEGGDVDVTEGLRWLDAAAAQLEPQALRHLEYIYREGAYGVPINLDRAKEPPLRS